MASLHGIAPGGRPGDGSNGSGKLFAAFALIGDSLNSLSFRHRHHQYVDDVDYRAATSVIVTWTTAQPAVDEDPVIRTARGTPRGQAGRLRRAAGPTAHGPPPPLPDCRRFGPSCAPFFSTSSAVSPPIPGAFSTSAGMRRARPTVVRRARRAVRRPRRPPEHGPRDLHDCTRDGLAVGQEIRPRRKRAGYSA